MVRTAKSAPYLGNVGSRQGYFIAEPLRGNRYGLERIAYWVSQEELSAETSPDLWFEMRAHCDADWSERRIMLARDIHIPGLVSLHEIELLSISHVRRALLMSGAPLLDLYRSRVKYRLEDCDYQA